MYNYTIAEMVGGTMELPGSPVPENEYTVKAESLDEALVVWCDRTGVEKDSYWQIVCLNTNDPNADITKHLNVTKFSEIRKDVEKCKKCELCIKRHNVVFGEGNTSARILFIGEAPGANEDSQGRPFVGRAGTVLDNMLENIGLQRESISKTKHKAGDIFITNIVKCRPPKNRKPTTEEVEACREYLNRQIDYIDPEIIVCLGKTAASTVLGLDKDMGSLTANAWDYNGKTVIVTYHPASTFYGGGKTDKLLKQFENIKLLINPPAKKQRDPKIKEEDYVPLGSMELLTTDNAAIAVLDVCLRCGIIAFDVETTGLNYKTNHIIGFSIAYTLAGEYKGFYFPLRHKAGVNVNFKKIKPKLKELLENEAITKVCHHAKFEMHMLHNEGIQLLGHEDTLLMVYCIDENRKNKQLKPLAKEFIHPSANYLEEQLQKVIKDIGIDKDCTAEDSINWSDIPSDKMSDYSCNDSLATLILREKLKERFKKDCEVEGTTYCDCVRKTYGRELSLTPVLCRIESIGLKTDLHYFANKAGELTLEMAGLKKKLTDLGGEKFNVNSSVQVSRIITDKLGFTPIKKTLKGATVVDDLTLQEFYDCEWTRALRTFRSLSKVLSTYLIPIMIKSDDESILRTNLHQHRAVNGRLSSSDPNLQNLPKHEKRVLGLDIGAMVRGGFVNWGDEWTTVFADYSQIELRIAACYAEITPLIDIFLEGGDPHSLTAQLMYNKKEVDSEERYFGKTFNFLATYGGGVKAIVTLLLKDQVSIDKAFLTYTDYAYYLSKQFHKAYPQVRIFMKFAERMASEKGWVKNHFSRVRRLPDNMAWMAFQYVVSSSAADVIKESMLKLDDYLLNKQSKMVHQIHDELIFKVHKTEYDEVIPKIRELMEYDGFKVPITVDIETSTTNWLERIEL